MSEYPLDWTVSNLGVHLKETKERACDSDIIPYSVSKVLGIVPQSEKFNKRVASSDISNYKVIRKGDFAYDPMLLWDGSINRMLREGKGAVSPAYVTFRVASDSLDADFLLHLLKASTTKTFYKSISKGTNIRRQKAEFDDFAAGEFAFPPLPEQKKIAEILSGIDSQIERLEKQHEQISRIQDLVSEDIIYACKKNFPSHGLGRVCALITKGATPTTFGHELSRVRFPGSVTFLGGGSTSYSGEYDEVPARYCTSQAVSTLSRSALKAGDSLITIVGASIGNTCQIPGSVLPANINQNVALIRSDTAILDCNYLSLYLKTEGKKALISISTTQAQPSVSLQQVGDLQIPLPPLGEQRKIGAAAASLQTCKIKLDHKIQKVMFLKHALSSDLLSGRKRVTL